MKKVLVIFFIAFYSNIIGQANLKVKNSSSLTVLEGSNIDVSGDFESESEANVVLKSGASIIVNGSKTGNITYRRNLPTDEYFLVSPPVFGQSYDDTYVDVHNIDVNVGLGINAIATYISSTNNWDWMLDGEQNLTFTSGVGYNVKLENNDNGGELSFTGEIAGDLVTPNGGVDFTLSYDSNSSGASGYDGYNWNLVGNPYPAYIKNSDFLSNSNIKPTIWTYNSTNQGSDNESLGGYQVRTSEIGDSQNGDFYIAPGQGFFVKSDSEGTINFSEANQYHQIEIGGSDTFQRTTPLTNIKLKVNNGTSSRKCDVYYLDNVTLGFDYGYEGQLYGGGGNPNSLAIYTQLLEDNEGVNYQTQSLPNTNYEGMVVPVGVDALANEEITISAQLNNFPANIKVFIEDKLENTFTRLDETSNFSTTLSTNSNSTGRFYLHTTSASLSTGNVLDNNPVSIFTTTRDNLRIVGVQSGTANVQMFNILGKQVFNTSFEGSGSNNINLPVLSSGVYIVQVKNESGTVNKKVVIE
jgi:hypothetical protein